MTSSECHRPAARQAWRVLLGGALLLALSATVAAKRHHHSGNTPGKFDYYLLTLSWAPEFCSTDAGRGASSECGQGHHFGFVVHGLWPENENGSYPQSCSSTKPVANDIVDQMMPIMPDSGLIQHEWSKHGTCSGLSTREYFDHVQKAFGQLQIPEEYRAPSHPISAGPSEIEQKFADANHAPKSAFRVSCSRSEFVALEVCLTKDLQYRQCGTTLHDCRAPHVTFNPVP